MTTKIMTLCVVHDDSSILLGMKKRGFGKDLYNGFGGKVRKGEKIIDAARRELEEEIGIKAIGIEKRGHLIFQFEGSSDILKVYLFHVSKYTGNPTEGDEMRPETFSFDNIPYKKMWLDDYYWLPLFIAGKNIKGSFIFDKAGKIKSCELKAD